MFIYREFIDELSGKTINKISLVSSTVGVKFRRSINNFFSSLSAADSTDHLDETEKDHSGEPQQQLVDIPSEGMNIIRSKSIEFKENVFKQLKVIFLLRLHSQKKFMLSVNNSDCKFETFF